MRTETLGDRKKGRVAWQHDNACNVRIAQACEFVANDREEVPIAG